MNTFNFNNLSSRLSNSEYYDFKLSYDETAGNGFGCIVGGECLVAHFDFNENETIQSGDTKIYSLTTWDGAINSGVTATTFGLTGIDNGNIFVELEGSDLTNQILVDALTGSTLSISSGDTRFFMTQISGMTDSVEYPMEYIASANSIGSYVNFQGGFYQGYYKLDGFDYEVLPNRVNKGMLFDFWLNKNDDVLIPDITILNDLNPDNKGIFFYWGTRAENKFWNQFEGNNTGSTSGCTIGATELCTIPKEIDIELINDKGFIIPLNPPHIEYTVIDNEFLLYGRAHQGCGDTEFSGLGTLRACEVTGDTPTMTISAYTETISNDTNPFLIYGRSKGSRCGGRPSDGYGRETACSFSGTTTPVLTLDKDLDIIDNALAFMIRDDGSIGYRLLTLNSECIDNMTVTGITIQEEFSISGIVKDNHWEHVSIRWVADSYLDDCELQYKNPRNGRLMFYVNCKLKFVAENFPEFIAKRLNEYKEKQVGVPFNISLGGGSQGLMESMTFDGQDQNDLSLAIETNFAGSFIGAISQFRIYNSNINWCALKTLCATNRYNI